MQHRGPCHIKRTIHVRVDHHSPGFGVGLPEARRHSKETRTDIFHAPACIVHEHVEFAEASDCFSRHALACPGIGHIGKQCERPIRAARGNKGIDLLPLSCSGHNNAGAFVPEPFGNGTANASPSTGYDCDFSVKLTHCLLMCMQDLLPAAD